MSSYEDRRNSNHRHVIEGLDNRRNPSSNPQKPYLQRLGQYETRRRRPDSSDTRPERLHSNLTPKLNKNDDRRYDKSRYAEYEIDGSNEGNNLKQNDYYEYESSYSGENGGDEGYIDDFTPYIHEDNGLKIPILPAPDPANHV